MLDSIAILARSTAVQAHNILLRDDKHRLEREVRVLTRHNEDLERELKKARNG